MSPPRLTMEQWAITKAILDKNDWNISAAARELKIDRQSVRQRISAAKNYGYTDENQEFYIKSKSTLYDAEGNLRLQWLKEDLDRERQEEIAKQTIAGLISEIEPVAPKPPPAITMSDVAVAYCIGDAHLGLYSWGAETGENFDLSVAKRDLMSGADRLVASVPAAEEAIVVQLGDFYHMDDTKNVTPLSGNNLDVDTRFAKVIRVGIHLMRYVIDKALEKHKLVRVRNVAGNHDPTASITLTEALKGYYENEPRVEIADSPKSFFIYRFGANLVGITHGHTGRPERLPGLLAVDAQKDWGECDFRFVWHGHIHSKRVFEDMGVIVESFRTLAGKDAWHAEQGYRPGREMQAIVLHKRFGEIERHTAGLKWIRSKED